METLALCLISECRRHLDEGEKRLDRCLGLLEPEQIWWRANERSNSPGNLVLHLAGNVRQWIVTGLGGQADRRRRALEFSAREPLSKDELMKNLSEALNEARLVLDDLNAERLSATLEVQGFSETGVGVLVHVVEHFSYHVGQVAWAVKAIADRDPDFYGDLELNDPPALIG